MDSPWSIWSYGNPAGAYLLLAIPLIICIVALGNLRQERMLKRLGNPAILRYFDASPFPRVNFWRVLLLSLAAVWTIIAFMDPLQEIPKGKEAGLTQLSNAQRIDQEIWLLLDTSASMGVQDEEGGESRLDVAKKTAEELLRLIPGRPVSLYTFTSQANLTVPLTWDQLFVALTLQHLSLDTANPGGTNFAALFDTLKKALSRHHFFANIALVMLTDGGDTAWEMASAEAKQQRLQLLRTKLPQSQGQRHTPLLIVGMGSTQGGVVPDVLYEGKPVHSSLDSRLLSALVDSPERLFISKNNSPYQLAKEIKEQLDRTLRYETAQQQLPTTVQTQSRFIFPLTLAILFLLAALSLPGIPTHQADSTRNRRSQ